MTTSKLYKHTDQLQYKLCEQKKDRDAALAQAKKIQDKCHLVEVPFIKHLISNIQEDDIFFQKVQIQVNVQMALKRVTNPLEPMAELVEELKKEGAKEICTTIKEDSGSIRWNGSLNETQSDEYSRTAHLLCKEDRQSGCHTDGSTNEHEAECSNGDETQGKARHRYIFTVGPIKSIIDTCMLAKAELVFHCRTFFFSVLYMFLFSIQFQAKMRG